MTDVILCILYHKTIIRKYLRFLINLMASEKLSVKILQNYKQCEFYKSLRGHKFTRLRILRINPLDFCSLL